MALQEGDGRLRVEWWLVALLSSALVLFLVADRTALRFDNLIYDSLLHLTEREPSPDILIVTIDNRSLQEVGPWPWTRDRHAQLIERLAEGHPKAIAYDVMFVEPSQPAADAALGKAMADAGSVFVPLLLNVPGRDGAAFDAFEPIAPVRASAGVGHANLGFDRDGLVRRMFLIEGEGPRQWLHLAELMRRKAGRGVGISQAEERTETAGGGLAARHPVMFAYAGPPGRFPTVSAAAVLRGEVPPEFLRNRLVLVGGSADGLGDQYPVPLAGRGGVMPGVEIIANLLDAMLTGHLIRPVEGWPLAIMSLLPLWMQLVGFRFLRPRDNIVLLVVLLGIVLAGAVLLLLRGLWVPPAAGMIGLMLVYPLWGWRRLEAVSSYMTDELLQLRAEADPLPRKPDQVAAPDLVARQSWLLHDAIGRMRDMRRFATDRLRQLPDATLVCDIEGKVLLSNARADHLVETLGVPEEERTQLAGLLAKLRYETVDRAEQQPTLPRAGDREAEIAGGEVASGDGRSFDLRFAPQRAEDDTLIGWVIRVVDISEAKALQRQREHVLQLLTHDMRSPQASIIAVLDNAAAGEIAPPMARRIEGYARRTLTLADDFVQLARAEAVDYIMEEVALGDLLIDAADDLWPQSSARGVAIEVEAPDDPILVRGERSLLTRAFINLIGNSIKYGDSGNHIRCVLEERAGMAVCTISDRGIGIAPDHLEHLFERFRRATPDGRQREDGAGLGLTFVHTVVTRHQGTIRCDSVLGEGTTFTVELPVIEDF